MPGLDDNPFIGLLLPDLQDLQGKYIQVLKDIAAAGQSYSFPGRSFTRANIPEVRSILTDLRAAIRVANGTGKQFANARIDTQGKFA